jgi:HEAT repeat protein
VNILLQSSLLLAGIAAAAVALLMVVLAGRNWGDRRRTRARWQVLAQLSPCFADPDRLTLAALETSGQYGFELVTKVLHQARRELSGELGDAIDGALEVIGEQTRLRHMALSWNRRKRLWAIDILSRCGGQGASSFLQGLLTHSDPVTRRFVRSALADLPGREQRRAALESYLEDEAEPYGWGATFFARVGRAAPEELYEWVQNRDLSSRHRKLVLESLADARFAQAYELARELLRADDPELRASAVRALGRTGPGDAESSLEAALADTVWFVRSAAAGALRSCVPLSEATVERLVSCLGDDNWWVRHNAARTLEATGVDETDLTGAINRQVSLDRRDRALGAWHSILGNATLGEEFGEPSEAWTLQ